MNNIFICGSLRSGTTLAHLMLNSHPDIYNPGEFDFLFDCLIGHGGIEPSVDQYICFLKRNRIFKSKSISIDPLCKTYLDVLYSIVNQIQNGKAICLNIHRNFDLALRYFPDAKFVHLIRDPRDVAKSSIRQGWSGTTYHGVDHWLSSEESWDRLMDSATFHQVFEFQYEILIEDTKTTLRHLCQFIGTEFSEDMLGYYRESSYSKPDVSLIDQWKRSQTLQEIELVEYKASTIMKKRGYELRNQYPRSPSLLHRVQLWLTNKRYKYMFCIQRYGFLLCVMDKMASMLPWLISTPRYRNRIHEIQSSHLK